MGFHINPSGYEKAAKDWSLTNNYLCVKLDCDALLKVGRTPSD